MPPCGPQTSGVAEISFLIIYNVPSFVKKNIYDFFGNTVFEVIWLKIWKQTLLFYIGGMIYTGLELLWRGFTHSSMFLLGGLCFLLIGALGRVPSPMKLPLRLPVCAGIVTMLELGCGMLVNRSYQVWDYRTMPLNFCGQICLPFTLLWIPVSLAAIFLYEQMDRRLSAYFH